MTGVGPVIPGTWKRAAVGAFLGALASGLPTAHAAISVAECVRKRAAAEFRRSIAGSPNLEVIGRQLLETDFSALPRQSAELPNGRGNLVLENNLKTGRSVLRFESAPSRDSTVLFDSSRLPASDRRGRLHSVSLSPDGREVVIRYRAYRGNVAFLEFRRPLPGEPPPAPTISTDPLLHNYWFLGSEEIAGGRWISMTDYGMNGSKDVILTEPDGQTRVLYSSFSAVANNSEQIHDFTISPSRRYCAIITYRDGSLDRFTLRIYDLETGQPWKTALLASDPTPSWSRPDELYVRTLDRTTGSPSWSTFDLRRRQRLDAPERLGTTADLNLSATEERPGVWRYRLRDGRDGNTVEVAPGQLIGRQGEDAVFAAWNDDYTLRRIERVPLRRPPPGGGATETASKPEVVYVPPPGLTLAGARLMGDHLVVALRRGLNHLRVIVDRDGHELGRFEIPDGATLSNVQWDIPGKSLRLDFASAVQPNVTVGYDLASGAFNRPNFARELLTRDGLEYITDIREVISADGARVPTRITQLRERVPGTTRPALIEVYGGFGLESPGFDPYFEMMKLRFMEAGGMLVAPILRGGGELGPAWRSAALKLGKTKTIDDVVATADYLISQGLSKPREIVVMGTSNGGLTAAAAALRKPESFGMAIPINGVLDLANAEALDPHFNGWRDEYGSNANPAEKANLRRLSPLETLRSLPAERPLPKFLIVGGEQDSRVNPLHSLRFYEAFRERSGTHPESVQFLSLPHSGHWVGWPYYQKPLGWSTQSRIWARIWDQLGWRFAKPPEN